MPTKIFFLTWCLLLVQWLHGQCPDEKILRDRIAFLKDSSKASPAEKLKELKAYERQMEHCPYRYDSTHEQLLRKIGATYFDQADYLNAVQYFKKSIDLIRSQEGRSNVNPRQLVASYYWVSLFYDSLNNEVEKLRALDSCVEMARKYKYTNRSSLSALYTRVEYFFGVGDYFRCKEYAERCAAVGWVYARSGQPNAYEDGISYMLSSLSWQVNALLMLQQHEEAEAVLNNKVNECKQFGLHQYLGTIYGQMAEVQVQKNNYVKAIAYFNLALANEQKAKHYLGCKQLLNTLAWSVYDKHYNDPAKALATYKRALTFINKESYFNNADAFESLNILTRMANLYVRKKDFATADLYFQKAFDQLQPGGNEQSIIQTAAQLSNKKKVHFLTGLLIDKADALLEKYYVTKNKAVLQQSILVYRKADELLDHMRTQQSDLESKLFWRNNSQRLYEHAIDACYAANNVADAFYFFEKSRSVLLLDQFNEQRYLGNEDILLQTQTRKRIRQLETELQQLPPSAAAFDEKQSELLASYQVWDRVTASIKNHNPLYYQQFLEKDFIGLGQVHHQILKEHDALMELFAGDSAVYALMITRNRNYFYRIDKTRFDSLATVFVQYIANPIQLNRHFPQYIQTAADLYKLIFQNVPVPAGRIIISPSGQYFPFEALITSATPVTYFIQQHAISYTYSARYLLTQFASPGSGSRNFMGIAPVQYPQALAVATLPGSDQSLKRLKGFFNGADNYLGDKASRSNFLQQFANYQIIQLYTHASGYSSRGEPVIYFADSLLYLSDLLPSQKPVASLVVLSACETGLGQLHKGEGVFSFNREFAAMGIPSAISNLWSIDNESTYELTELFYKNLSSGMPTDLALQKAKLQFLSTAGKERTMPYYWAAPVLVGKVTQVTPQVVFPWKWVLLGVSIVLLTATGFILHYQRKKFFGDTLKT